VGGILMHVMGERQTISGLLLVTVFLVAALIGIIYWTQNDDLEGTETTKTNIATQGTEGGDH
jgi:uncharacterized membrane protein